MEHVASQVSGTSSEWRMLLHVYMHLLGIFFFFFHPNMCFYFIFWWSIKFLQQNINQSESRIGEKKLSVELYWKICPAYISKHNSEHEKRVILLMTPNNEGWHYIIAKLSALLRRITSFIHCIHCTSISLTYSHSMKFKLVLGIYPLGYKFD